MKKIWSALVCACLALTGCGAKEVPIEKVEMNQLVPDELPSHEEMAQNALDLAAAAQDSLAQMKKAAAEKGEKAQALAEEVCGKVEARVGELAGLDYLPMTEEEIGSYMQEIGGIITTLREARDAIEEL